MRVELEAVEKENLDARIEADRSLEKMLDNQETLKKVETWVEDTESRVEHQVPS